MKNNIKKMIIGLSGLAILISTTTAFTEPGSESDPLVSLSYVEKKIEQLKYYVDEKLNTTNNSTNNSWIVAEVPAGKSLICKDGTEIILRSGQARAIAIVVDGIMNGLTDVTEGKDLVMEETIISNHLLIVPRDDGRGARALTNCFFLVKGDYEIK